MAYELDDTTSLESLEGLLLRYFFFFSPYLRSFPFSFPFPYDFLCFLCEGEPLRFFLWLRLLLLSFSFFFLRSGLRSLLSSSSLP